MRPRRFTGNEAQARSLIAQRALEQTIPLAGAEMQLSLEPVLELSKTSDNDWRIDAQWAGARFQLSLPAGAGLAWIEARFPGLDLPALPPAFASAALEEALGDALDALRALGRGPAQIDRLEMAPSQPGGVALEQRFALTLQRNGQTLHGSLATDSLGLMLIAGLFSPLPPVPNALDHDALPIVLRAELGRSVLPADVLARLAIHDVILIEHCWIGQNSELWLGRDSLGVRVRCDDTQLIVTQALSETGLNMTATESVTFANAAPASLDSIPVHLSFDLGERSISLGELKALQPGQTFDLGRPLATSVNIRANGALIGYGELIEVDGRLGISIAALAEKT